MLNAWNGKVNETCFSLIKSFSLIGEGRKIISIVSKRYSNRIAQDKKLCLFLTGKRKEGFPYEVMLELMASRKDEDSISRSENSIAKAQSITWHSLSGNHRYAGMTVAQAAGELGRGQVLLCLALHLRE